MLMDNLKLALLLMLLVGHLDEAFSQDIKSDFALVKTPYTFPGNASTCQRAEWRKTFPADATIAAYQSQICMTEKGYHGEFTCKENHLLLNSAKYTDLGLYVFVCDGVEKSLKLDVLYPLNVYVAEMNNLTLDCHADSANGVTWLRNNEIVLYSNKDGSINPGKGYEGRVSLEKTYLKTGNLSLTIAGFRKTDEGIYRCFLDDGTTKGYPHTYLLQENEKRSSQADQTDSNCNEAQTLIIYKWSTIVLGILLAVVVVVVVGLLYKLYYPTSKPLKDQSTPATATFVKKSDDGPTENTVLFDNTESQSMVNRPVQESDTTGNKPSNTRPF